MQLGKAHSRPKFGEIGIAPTHETSFFGRSGAAPQKHDAPDLFGHILLFSIQVYVAQVRPNPSCNANDLDGMLRPHFDANPYALLGFSGLGRALWLVYARRYALRLYSGDDLIGPGHPSREDPNGPFLFRGRARQSRGFRSFITVACADGKADDKSEG